MALEHLKPKKKKFVHPGDPREPRPGYGLIKPEMLVGAIVVFALGFYGIVHWMGALLFGILLLTWSVDNDYFDYT